jgi:hypothetical protein
MSGAHNHTCVLNDVDLEFDLDLADHVRGSAGLFPFEVECMYLSDGGPISARGQELRGVARGPRHRRILVFAGRTG